MSHKQIQADWAETDSTKVSYIPNKPFVPTNYRIAPTRFYPQGETSSVILLANSGPDIDTLLLNIDPTVYFPNDRISGTTLFVNHWPNGFSFTVRCDIERNSGSGYVVVDSRSKTVTSGAPYNEEDFIISLILPAPVYLQAGSAYRFKFYLTPSFSEQVIGVEVIS